MKKLILSLLTFSIFTTAYTQEFGDTKNQVLQKLKQKNQLHWYEESGSSLISVGPSGQTMSLDFKNNRLWGKTFTEPQASLLNARKSLSEYIKKYKSEGYKVFKNEYGDVSNGGITCEYGNNNFKVYILIQIINNKYLINHSTYYEIYK